MPATPRYSVDLTIEERKRLKLLADINDRSVAAEIRLAVREYLERYSRGSTKPVRAGKAAS